MIVVDFFCGSSSGTEMCGVALAAWVIDEVKIEGDKKEKKESVDTMDIYRKANRHHR